MNEKRKKQTLWAVRCLLTVLLCGFVFWAWPGYLAHDFYTSETYSGHYELTDILTKDAAAAQYFIPQNTRLGEIMFAAVFNGEYPEGAEIGFVLCEESGKEIFSQKIPLDQMESSRYYSVAVNQKVKTGQKYYWVLTGPTGDDTDFQIMYTNHEEDQAPENELFLVQEEQIGESAQSVSQYTYMVHPDKIIVIGGYWLGALLVYLFCMDVANRLLGVKGK